MQSATYAIDETVYSSENIAQAVADFSSHFPSDELVISFSGGTLSVKTPENPDSTYAEFMNYLLSLHV